MKTRLFIFLMMALTLVRCNDSETFKPEPDPIIFTASAFVEVKDIDGIPLQGVRINVGDVEGYTDDEGVLYLKDIEMNPATYLTAYRSGYFHGSRRFYPTEDQTHFIQIVLLPEQLAGSIQAETGGLVQVNSGVQLKFAPGSVVDENEQTYNGAVSVYAQPILADDPDLSFKMPGDLVGITVEEEKGALASLGMVAVELRSAAGEILKVKSGSTVEMTMPVPADMLGTAPATIPMWYFDEEAGYWKEEGTANLVGNTYIAQLPHFSFWNCDYWFEFVKWGSTFVYENGEAASDIYVCLTALSLNTTTCGITNDEGFVCGLIPSNEALLLEIRNPCGAVIYSQQIGPYSDTTMIGPITIPGISSSLMEISGVAVDCNGDPVTNGFVGITMGTVIYHIAVDETTGGFSSTVINCDQSDVVITAYDAAALKQSLPANYPYAPNIDAGTMTVCENLTELVDIELVGLPDHFFYYFPNAGVQGNITTFNAADSSSNFKYFYVMIEGTSEGTYPATAAEIGFTLPNGDRGYATGISVTLTYFGAVGDYISGTLSGTLHTGPNGQGGPDYPLQGTFTILRDY